MSSIALTEDLIRRAPKVQLHDHLDGGLRPSTVIELAREIGYRELPTEDPVALGAWFHEGANKGDLVEYLRGFAHTLAVMQTRESIERVTWEMMEDMRDDGVVYIETRFCPTLHTENGLYPEAVVEAVLAGLERGSRDFGVGYGLILCALRNMTDSLEIAELAVNFRDRGVVGFDLAGEEGGYPPKRHLEAFTYCMRENFNITIHAGEAFGTPSIWQALTFCGAHRIGHATRLTEDLAYNADGEIKLGSLAQYILDKRIPLEICLLSNSHTGAVDKLENHPFGDFLDLGFRCFLNTDDRLMSDTTLTKEFVEADRLFGLDFAKLEKLNLNAMKSAFIHYDERLHYIYKVIKAGYADIRRELAE